MEKQQDTTPLKVRSFRKVLTTGYQHYTSHFRAFFKASWLIALPTALLFGALATALLVYLPLTLLAPIFLCLMPLAIPVVYALIRRLLKRQHQFWFTRNGNFRLHLRHCGLIVAVMLSSTLLTLLASCLLLMPAAILCLANMQALQGMLIGDPSGMPSYMIALTFATFVFTAFMQFYVSQPLLVHHYFACGSVDAREAERRNAGIN